jgi:Sulfotransferase domain
LQIRGDGKRTINEELGRLHLDRSFNIRLGGTAASSGVGIITDIRVFGLGLSRTGTTSLTEALNLLGFRARHYPSLHYFLGCQISLKERELQEYDALTDISVIPFYKQLDKRFPGAKFILTERSVDEWLDSCKRFHRFKPEYKPSREDRDVRRAVYGTVIFNREKFRAAYVRHRNDVLAHFAERPNDLLLMDITAGQRWETLCPFLDRSEPDAQFPRLNAI